jgi:hypothetical protein
MSAYYRGTLADFLADDPKRVLGELTAATPHNELQRRQIKAWEREVGVLKSSGADLIKSLPDTANWTLFLEYPIPRRMKRLDAVLLADDIIFCLEFKTEDKSHSRQAQRQVEDYALDLRDFHEASNGRIIIPVVVVPKAPSVAVAPDDHQPDVVRCVRLANAVDLAAVLGTVFTTEHQLTNQRIDPAAWDNSAYRPVPTIIEAAESLYAGHNVREIAHSQAGDANLTLTSDKIVEIIQEAQQKAEKVVCFVTGVPGAGKTLAGLNVAHNPALRQEGRPAGVFLSGNGPLVKIVSAAIARDYRRRVRAGGAEREVSTFIQNVHEFVHEGLEKPDKPPIERVVIFDEAQRAWNADQNRKKNGLEVSEPETMLSILDRHKDWAVLVALIGGGQEIHNGEAGLAEWGSTLRDKFPHWRVAVSPNALQHDASLAGHRLFADKNPGSLEIRTELSLHLAVNRRSFRASRLAEWVDAVLTGQPETAFEIFRHLDGFPMALTRSLSTARSWLRQQTRGRRRSGLVASSGALRLRADGLELSSGFRQGNRDMYVHWFLDEPPDIRSSNQLEIAASEFECQGLELDWVGVCWGGDFALDDATGNWVYHSLSGTRWGNVGKEIDRQYLLNSYRVLLTRARQGLVIWIPEGDQSDITRLPAPLDATVDYLKRCGLTVV